MSLFRRNTNIFCGIVGLSRIYAYSLGKCVFVKTGVFSVETDAFSVQFKNNPKFVMFFGPGGEKINTGTHTVVVNHPVVLRALFHTKPKY